MSSTVANIEIGATTSRLLRGLRSAGRAVVSFAADARKNLGSIKWSGKTGIGEAGKSAIGNLAGNMAMRGLDILADAARDTYNLERSLVRFQIASKGSAASTNALRRQVTAISDETGIARDKVLAGSSAYVALTGDAAGATTAMRSFARIAQASGSSVEDVAGATAALKISMGLQAQDIEKVFSGMVVQGKEGAVELKDMAGELAALAPQFAQFKGAKSVEGIAELGAALQVVRTGAGSASMAATNLRALMTQIADPEVIRKLGKLKIRIFDKDPKTGVQTMRSASDVIQDLASNQQLLDPKIMATVFGREEARAALRSLQQNLDMYGNLKEAAKDSGAIQRDLNTYLQSSAGKIEASFNKAKLALAEAFTPERIEKFAQALAKVAGLVTKIVDGIENLFDDAGIEEMFKGDHVGAATAKYMKNTERLSAEEKRAKASELFTKANVIDQSGKTDASDELAIKGLQAAAAKLTRQADVESSQAFAAAVGAEMRGALQQFHKQQSMIAVERLSKNLLQGIKDAFPKLEVGRKEVVAAVGNSSQHNRSPAR